MPLEPGIIAAASASGGIVALELVAAAALVAANGFFVACEFGLARVRESQADQWIADRRPGAKSVRHAVDHIDAYLAACQLGITLASLALGAVGEPAFHALLEPVLGESARIGSVGLASILGFSIITMLHVVVGELAPKSAAIARTEGIALAVLPLLRVFYLVTRPVVQLFNGLGNLLLKPFGIPPASEVAATAHSERELRQLIRESGEGGEISSAETSLTENAFDFDERRVREVLVPRRRVVLLHEDDDLQTAARTAVDTGVTRMPICAGDQGLDDVVGVVHAKDLLGALVEDGADGARTPRELARPAVRVADAAFVGGALRDMRRERMHLAIVLDEHGTAVGIVTVEDVVEELVGEIEDEFDAAAGHLVREEEDHLVVDGAMPVYELLGRLADEGDDDGGDGEDERDAVHEATVGGHVLETLGRVPDRGERLLVLGRRTEVTAVEEGLVRELRLERARATDEGEGED